MRKFILPLVILLLMVMSPIEAYADEYEDYLSAFDLSSFEILDKETQDFLQSIGADNFNYESITDLSFTNVITYIQNVFIKSINSPLKTAAVIIAFIIISSYVKTLNTEINDGEISSFFSTISALIISIFIAKEITDCINVSYSTIKLCVDFSYAFFPAFCIIVATSGGTVTSFSVNTLLLSLSQGMNYISDLIFIPLINCFLALGICSSVRSEINLSSLCSSLKKLITVLISSLSALYISVLSIKTAVASKADALGLRSMRFAINSVVPVIGPSISEGLISIQSYSSLIKTGVGIVGIIGVFSTFLPALCQVVSWRLTLFLCSICSDVFDDKSTSQTVNAFRDALMIIEVILILSMLTTIISIGILVAAKTVE